MPKTKPSILGPIRAQFVEPYLKNRKIFNEEDVALILVLAGSGPRSGFILEIQPQNFMGWVLADDDDDYGDIVAVRYVNPKSENPLTVLEVKVVDLCLIPYDIERAFPKPPKLGLNFTLRGLVDPSEKLGYVAYSESLEWVNKFLINYGISGVLVTPDNWEQYRNHFEYDDTMQQVAYKSIVILKGLGINSNTVQLGLREYEVRELYLQYENGWFSWTLTLVDKDDQRLQFLDLRILEPIREKKVPA